MLLLCYTTDVDAHFHFVAVCCSRTIMRLVVHMVWESTICWCPCVAFKISLLLFLIRVSDKSMSNSCPVHSRWDIRHYHAVVWKWHQGILCRWCVSLAYPFHNYYDIFRLFNTPFVLLQFTEAASAISSSWSPTCLGLCWPWQHLPSVCCSQGAHAATVQPSQHMSACSWALHAANHVVRCICL